VRNAKLEEKLKLFAGKRQILLFFSLLPLARSNCNFTGLFKSSEKDHGLNCAELHSCGNKLSAVHWSSLQSKAAQHISLKIS
jgi:hypothetical protein